MKNTKRFLIVFIILILVLISVIVFIISNTKNDEQNISIQSLNENFEAKFELKQIKSATQYTIINNCIKKYYSTISNEEIYDLLIEDYIEKNDITKNNFSNKLQKIDYNYDYLINTVYEYETNLSIKTYFVYGNLINKDNYSTENNNFVINIDYTNNTFEIAPFDNVYDNYIKKENDKIISIDTKIEEKIQSINKNDSNYVDTYIAFKEKDVMTFYFNQYILNLVYITEIINLLDSVYKQKRFGDYSNFKEYVESNIEDLSSSFIMKYKIKEFTTYKEYLCIDNYGNYYIFKETTPMEYTVLLDQYTINDKIFTDEYNKKEDNIKAQMNLNKFEQMLNRQDFTSAYNVLNKDFKAKYFETEDKFKQYVLDNWFKYNKFDYEEVSGNKIKTSITNRLNTGEESKTKRFRVDIEKNEFYISFDI